MRAALEDVLVAVANPATLGETIRSFLGTAKPMLLLTFAGDPKKYLDEQEVGGVDVIVFKFNNAHNRVLNALYSYVYGLNVEPVFPCGAILLSRRAAECVLTTKGRGYTPLIKSIHVLMKSSRSVKFATLQAGAGAQKGFPITTFLLHVVLVGLLDSSLLRFMVVGLSGVLVNLGVLDAQVHLLGLYSNPYLAVPLAFECSVIWNFGFNNWFTFRAENLRKLRFVEYNASTLGSFAVQFISVYTLTTRAHFHYLLASVVGIILGFFVNYTVSLWIWRKPQLNP
ncbi:MAG: GtrA family protein [Thermoprotei archaeon]